MTKTKRLIIRVDCDAESPREWDNVGTMVCWHRRYNLGDEQPKASPDEWLRNLAAEHVGAYDADLIPDEHITRIIAKHFIVLPLYLYDHSGLAMNTGGYHCPWDSGQVGYIYCTRAKAIAECTTIENAQKCLRGEVETYSQFIGGDVYGFEVVEFDEDEDDIDDGEVLDSCWGFYGADPRENGMADHLGDEFADLLDDPLYL